MVFCLSGMETFQRKQVCGTGCRILCYNMQFIGSVTFNSRGFIMCARRSRRQAKHVECSFDVG
ncbi:hypothetical protein NC653_028015 [Populus alba x Populus x berolinensis]|uniref:Uncharacterized protein n=1 Tax=Populus alba x Populus x berolinensis TaxID=444605 RepID=A0AAD6M6U6_9ROSI|nr:hypothetical protein NC653_028015 [Populus alba x Populus x berolinensis]